MLDRLLKSIASKSSKPGDKRVNRRPFSTSIILAHLWNGSSFHHLSTGRERNFEFGS
jgi:hypothetical protein